MSGWMSTAKPLSYEWAVQHMAYDQGKRDAEEQRNVDESTAHDRDETRRLLYMALAAPRTKRYNLVGTLVNALAHHGSNVNPRDAMEHLITFIEGGSESSREWLQEQIDRLTAEESA